MGIGNFIRGIADVANEEILRRFMENSVYSNRLLFLNTLALSPLPAGDFVKTVTGDVVEAAGGGYVDLYQNDTGHPVAVTIYAVFSGVPGKQAKLSLSNSKETTAIVDYLSTTTSDPAYGIKRVSDTILLLPKQRVFIGNARTAFPLAATDKFTPRVFDLASYLVHYGWQSKN